MPWKVILVSSSLIIFYLLKSCATIFCSSFVITSSVDTFWNYILKILIKLVECASVIFISQHENLRNWEMQSEIWNAFSYSSEFRTRFSLINSRPTKVEEERKVDFQRSPTFFIPLLLLFGCQINSFRQNQIISHDKIYLLIRLKEKGFFFNRILSHQLSRQKRLTFDEIWRTSHCSRSLVNQL